jgi:Mrp family chromosome partitioning ATPase
VFARKHAIVLSDKHAKKKGGSRAFGLSFNGRRDLAMTLMIGMVSQKGGVGKSTMSRLVAREYAAAGWEVKIADLDVSQGTSLNFSR